MTVTKDAKKEIIDVIKENGKNNNFNGIFRTLIGGIARLISIIIFFLIGYIVHRNAFMTIYWILFLF